MNPHYPVVAARAGHRCEYCAAPEAIFNFPFEVEHVLPANQGGADSDGNLALACRACNLFKSDHTTSYDRESGTSVPLFHPREQHWQDHFRIATESGAIVGRTPTGRATLSCLRINAENQLTARRQWMRLGLFP